MLCVAKRCRIFMNVFPIILYSVSTILLRDVGRSDNIRSGSTSYWIITLMMNHTSSSSLSRWSSDRIYARIWHVFAPFVIFIHFLIVLHWKILIFQDWWVSEILRGDRIIFVTSCDGYRCRILVLTIRFIYPEIEERKTSTFHGSMTQSLTRSTLITCRQISVYLLTLDQKFFFEIRTKLDPTPRGSKIPMNYDHFSSRHSVRQRRYLWLTDSFRDSYFRNRVLEGYLSDDLDNVNDCSI